MSKASAKTRHAARRRPRCAGIAKVSLAVACVAIVVARASGQVSPEAVAPDSLVGRVSLSPEGSPAYLATVAARDASVAALVDESGTFRLPASGLTEADTLVVRMLGYESSRLTVAELRERPTVRLLPADFELAEARVVDRRAGALGQGILRDVDGTAIYAGRKNELIVPDDLQANLATNNAREIFKGVAGLTVWESDAAGLQLSIGARGLDPNRSSNFNARQNGFDISADALGYPESYYTPPAQALQRIELVRGAASLQYGTQFGGLLNFKLKEGDPERRLAVVSEQTVGSYGLFGSFNSVGGTVGKTSYYAFGQYKRGEGWRDNAGFEQATGYLDVHYQLSPRTRIGLELTRMSYLAQQPGGLVDFEFERDARASKRARNWFDVDWGLAALHLDHDLSARTQLNVRTFVLDAGRRALGELGPINRPDPLRERQLIDGRYRNFGQEVRLLHRYDVAGLPATLVVGTRVYSGDTRARQGLGSAGDDADFRFLNPGALETSDFAFPSRNYAAFAEHLFNLPGGWSVTPGLRAEYIRTASEGYYRRRVTAGADVLLDTAIADAQRNVRGFVIAGLGVARRFGESLEAYANASQNYRAINFSDLVVVNPNLVIDSTLRDERGHNLELGLRGAHGGGVWRFDVSLFRLHYANRIGVREASLPDAVLGEREVSVRTNVGRAAVHGIEFYGEVDALRALGTSAGRLELRPFLNASYLHARYRSGGRAIEGRAVEQVPPLSLKTGIAAAWGPARAQVLLTHVREHYSDATNAVRVADATRGVIPTYTVADVTASYTWRVLRLQVGANNLLDARYFTRRATGYPGPGVLPAEARSAYASLRVSL